MNEQLRFAIEISSRLDSAGIPYMFTGSVAASLYALPRMTRDIDLVVACGPEDAESIIRLFEADCYVDADSVRGAIANHSMFNVIHNDWAVKGDFIVRKDEPYRRVEFSRRRSFLLEGRSLWVVAPEDLILSKLLWAKKSASELQTNDVRGLLLAVRDLDRSYLEKWAVELDVQDLLAKAGRP